MYGRSILATLLLAGATTSCRFSDEPRVARTAAAENLRCPEDQLREVPTRPQNRYYRFQGCGHRAIIDCVSSPGGTQCYPVDRAR